MDKKIKPNTKPLNPRIDTEEFIIDGKKYTTTINKGGRPTKYKTEFNNWLVEHFERGGAFDTFGGYIYHKLKKMGLSFEEIDKIKPSQGRMWDWVNPKSSEYIKVFHETKRKYEELARMYWLEGKTHDKRVSDTKWKIMVANRYGYRDKQDVTSNDQTLSGPTIYRPEKYQIEGEIVEPLQIKGEKDEDN